MKLYRVKIEQPGVGTVERFALNAVDDTAAMRAQGDHWNRYSTAEPGRYRSKLFRRSERKPLCTIG